jgi:nucleoside 2-deoxyribosyltransferase
LNVYVASPLGFSEAGRAFDRKILVPALRRAGHRVLDPWASPAGAAIARARRRPEGRARRAALGVANAGAARANQHAIDRADAVVAVLDGADVDSGTAAEIGYAFARGKPIVGYRGDWRPAGDNEGAIVNLQVEYFVRASGGAIVTRVADIVAALRTVRPRPSAGASASRPTRRSRRPAPSARPRARGRSAAR